VLGWHPLNPTPQASAIAAATASAARIPSAAPALRARERPIPEGERRFIM